MNDFDDVKPRVVAVLQMDFDLRFGFMRSHSVQVNLDVGRVYPAHRWLFPVLF
jgi:hypothetical protein